jgi:hypothetical protein
VGGCFLFERRTKGTRPPEALAAEKAGVGCVSGHCSRAFLLLTRDYQYGVSLGVWRACCMRDTMQCRGAIACQQPLGGH